jgi:hypothetical protein
MRFRSTAWARIALIGTVACAEWVEDLSEQRVPIRRRTAPDGPIPVAEKPPLPQLAAPAPPTGERILPGGYPDVEPTFYAGQRVLLPGRATVDRYFLHPELPVHYELGTVIERGRRQPELVLVSRTGAPTQVPGALVVALGTETTPAPGTWVLTPRASGYGWTRAVVNVGAGDAVLLAPVPADPAVGTLSGTRSLMVPIEQGGIGASVACRDKEDAPWTRYTVFGVEGSKLLHLSENDRLGVHHASACIALDLTPKFAVGEPIMASHFGTFEPAKVLEITDAGYGVRVRFDSTGREVTLPLLDVAHTLEEPGTGFAKRKIQAPPAPPPTRAKPVDAPVVLSTIPSNATDAPISEAEAEAAAIEENAGATENAAGEEAGAAPSEPTPEAPRDEPPAPPAPQPATPPAAPKPSAPPPSDATPGVDAP